MVGNFFLHPALHWTLWFAALLLGIAVMVSLTYRLFLWSDEEAFRKQREVGDLVLEHDETVD